MRLAAHTRAALIALLALPFVHDEILLSRPAVKALLASKVWSVYSGKVWEMDTIF